MLKTLAILLCLATVPCVAQTTSTLCQGKEVIPVGSNVTELQLIGCGEGYPDNLLWNLDRADSLSGSLDTKLTRTATGKGAVVYVMDTGIMRVHDEFARPDGPAVIGAIYAPGNAAATCSLDPALDPPCWQSDSDFLLSGRDGAETSEP